MSAPTSASSTPKRLPGEQQGAKDRAGTKGAPRRATSRAAREAAARFRILLPATWMILPLAPEGRQQRIRRLVRRRVGTSDELAAARYAAATELERAAEAAVEAGVFFAATYDELFGDVPVSASLTVSVTPIGLASTAERPFSEPERPLGDQSGTKDERPAPEGDGDDLDGLAGRMAARLEGEGTRPDELGVVELPIGAAVRSRSRVHSDLWGSDGKELRPATVQYLVPLPGGDHMLAMSFSTPIVPLADRFAQLFDAMARTARID